MRSKKADLEEVLADFEGWRARPHGRGIPDKLWSAALALLDRYSASAICRDLGLNPARFKQIREARGVAPGDRRPGRRLGGGIVGRPRTGPHSVTLDPGSNAFVELPPLGVGVAGGMFPPPGREAPRGTAGYRLILESGAGTLTVVTATPDHGLVDAVCRFVLGALGSGSGA